MDKQRIWAPWRIGYIAPKETESLSAAHAPKQPTIVPSAWLEGSDRDCFLCQYSATYTNQVAAADRQNLVLWRGEQMTVLLNRYPYTNGHLLVSPRRHVAAFDKLSDQEHLEGMRLLARFTQLLAEIFQADGFNIGLNLGSLAGAGVPGHLHWHLVPRWKGDHNFMPTIAGTRVIPQSLDAAWEAISTKVGCGSNW